ncbi:conserved exported hypothetical protein [Bosea sp. 62]|uniref:hypothetical protein n=1 Tax=unclassified Bosea (in: a-proteobacteria) TaxID=2653178 RepID=UPI001255CA69|nr:MULTISPECIES: hypothetical protein [unclassified Bosea (in: a-proteobacteria)]CAD5286756.1 conserved exported hypothetical protein [Bosea sp. 21B]CAD5289253.1 conserved exported hypothetical protein [Bosea sp. 46]CAD5301212.1 conserved exported hypothetical protein [Bosea sp. 7B]VVT60534.1 conserved exported hypothetical protein [Bosea sp. EC-HK365B]VXB03829.1 conserved exported hypothetical protein [Bosea sp. 62]
MDRRSFLVSLIGGLAAAGSLGTAVLAAPQPKSAVEPPLPEPAPQVDAEALDKADADYARYYYRRRRRWRRRYWRRRRYYYRPRYYYRRRYYRPRYYYRRRYW